ncbi:MAG: lactoferrin/transferrin family TonB-dependent receptor [Moraxella sp.]|nr:lactoferrin/transferrin family TonB-dependent receptor [Moraxella sp.]
MNCRLSHLSVAVCAVLFGGISPAMADEAKVDDVNAGTPNVVLDELEVVAKKRFTKKSEEVTGLGKTVKTSQDINEQQILSVRDLVKDTPGVAVVEQGRGASSGYTMRGMDKNRVAVTVDGLHQAQSYLVQKRQIGEGREGSGAINEIELENVSAVQISQGASGTESGSGGLGGAVSFRTKSVDDVLDDEEKFATFYKGAYASRDKQTMHSAGFALRGDKADLLVQYTDRTKSEVRPHKDILKTEHGVWRWGSTAEDFANGNIAFDRYRFVLVDECPTYDTDMSGCHVKQKVLSKPVLQKMSAKDYTGKNRVLGDPMAYDSASYLVKMGYNLNPAHRIEGVYEHTEQNYNTQDMTKEAYHLIETTGIGALGNSRNIYRGNNYHEAFYTPANIAGYWTQARFIDEKHDKDRVGLSYYFKNPSSSGLIDHAKISFDHQAVNIDNFVMEKYCSVYPHVDKNCTPSADKPNSGEKTNRTTYDERHHVLRADFGKLIDGKTIRHQLSAGVGMDKFKSERTISDIHEKNYRLDYDFVKDKGDVEVWAFKGVNLLHDDVCQSQQQWLGEARKCGSSIITGHNVYANIKDTISLGSLAELNLGLRHDVHQFDSDDDWTGTGKYRNTSWNAGLVFKPTDSIDVMYRISSGYRVPSFKELFGYRLDGVTKADVATPPFDRAFKHEKTNVRPEKALNQEFGISLKRDWGNIDVSYFDNRYKDLIDLTLKSYPGATPLLPSSDIWAYRNYQDVHLTGVTLGGKLYFDALSDKLPSGLTGRLAYLKTNVKSNKLKDVFVNADGYFLDTITPTRYVLGLDYAADSDKWGLGATWTYTGAKDANELKAKASIPSGKDYERQATTARSRSWHTLDLSAFYRPNQYMTVRGSVQNALNHRYSTWESLRQTSITSGNAHEQNSFNQYAAPGRNFVVSLEMKY